MSPLPALPTILEKANQSIDNFLIILADPSYNKMLGDERIAIAKSYLEKNQVPKFPVSDDAIKKEAFSVLQTFAEAGDKAAQFALARQHKEKSKDRLKWTQKSADQGYPPAQYILATYIAEGKYNFEKDPKKAAILFKEIFEKSKNTPHQSLMKKNINIYLNKNPLVKAAFYKEKISSIKLDKETITNFFIEDRDLITQESFKDIIRDKQLKIPLTFDELNKHFILTPTGRIYEKKTLLNWITKNKTDPLITKLELRENELIRLNENNFDLEKLNKALNESSTLIIDKSEENKTQKSTIERYLHAIQSKESALEFLQDKQTMNLATENQIINILFQHHTDSSFRKTIIHSVARDIELNTLLKGKIFAIAMNDKNSAIKVLGMYKDYKHLLLNADQIIDIVIKHLHEKDFAKKIFPLFSIFSKISINLAALAKVNVHAFERIIAHHELLEKLGKNNAIKIANYHINEHQEIIKDNVQNKTPLQQIIFTEIKKIQGPLVQTQLIQKQFEQLPMQFDMIKELMENPVGDNLTQAVGFALNLSSALEKNKIPALSDLFNAFNSYLDQNPILKRMMNENLDPNEKLDADTRHLTTFKPVSS